MWVSFYLHNQCQGECHRYKEVFRGDLTRLEDVMTGKHNSTFREKEKKKKKKKGKKNVQDGYVTEENAYEQRADRGRYHGAVHAPCRWLVEDTRPSRARRQQVTTNYLSSPGQKKWKKYDGEPPLHND